MSVTVEKQGKSQGSVTSSSPSGSGCLPADSVPPSTGAQADKRLQRICFPLADIPIPSFTNTLHLDSNVSLPYRKYLCFSEKLPRGQRYRELPPGRIKHMNYVARSLACPKLHVPFYNHRLRFSSCLGEGRRVGSGSRRGGRRGRYRPQLPDAAQLPPASSCCRTAAAAGQLLAASKL